jgi:uncharacterized membrane protein (UPF0127 family)
LLVFSLLALSLLHLLHLQLPPLLLQLRLPRHKPKPLLRLPSKQKRRLPKLKPRHLLPSNQTFWFAKCPLLRAFFLSQNPAMNTLVTGLLSVALLGCGTSHAQDAPQLDLPRIKLGVGMYLVDTQVAATPQQRAIGLMLRKQMPQAEGMLFVFEQAGQQCFWMKNTLLPLTAAFVADDGTIVNLADMRPQTLESHCSTKPVRFVLEMNQGWFAQKGIKAGFKLSGPPFKPGTKNGTTAP